MDYQHTSFDFYMSIFVNAMTWLHRKVYLNDNKKMNDV